MTYLITGATGTVGASVVEMLLARSERPAVFVRDVSKARRQFGGRVDVHHGDLADADSLTAALCAGQRVLLINAGPELGLRDELAAHAARAAGVSRVVKLSTIDVEYDVGTGPWHARGEAAIRASGVEFTFVRPAGFMDNTLARAATSGIVVLRVVDNNGDVSFAGTMYRAGRPWRGKQVEVSIVAGSVQIACAGTVVRTHAIRHDPAKEHGAYATPHGRPRKPRQDAPNGAHRSDAGNNLNASVVKHLPELIRQAGTGT
jgi:NAD(P)-dependent dehydrogenase (short-subunit alcohol dehydrogenase family)